MKFIPLNSPYTTQSENRYIHQSIRSGNIGGNGPFTLKCHRFFEKKYGLKKCFLTSSCTGALEMIALLSGIKNGDEVIIPSYTFVSTANAFLLRGATIVFADSQKDNPNIDASEIEKLITPKTKAIVVVHYGGVACDMDNILSLAKKHNLIVVEDAAQGIDSYYKHRPVGSIGHFGAMSFHFTKNITSGEGGLLVINEDQWVKRAEIIWEKGTNKSAFLRGEVSKYTWVDIGSSFLPSDLTAAFLFAQLEKLKIIQKKRVLLWNCYFKSLKKLCDEKTIKLPVIPDYATINGHLFYLVCRDEEERTALIRYLRNRGIQSSFHYQSLHRSPFFSNRHDGRNLPHADHFSACLLRLPLYYQLKTKEIEYVSAKVTSFYK